MYSDLFTTEKGVEVCTAQTISAGADWLSLTLPREAENAFLWHVGNCGIVRTIASGGFVLENRSIYGYTGLGAGASFAGIGTDRYMAILGGERASLYFDACFRSDANVPRLDIQCTVKYDKTPFDIAKRSYYDASAFNNQLPEHRRRKLFIIMGSDGGDTFYLGSPTSEARGRVYNKEREAKDINFTGCWRYEVSFKNDAAKRLAAVIAAQNGGRAHYIASYVRNWYAQRGVTVAYECSGDNEVLPPTKRAKTDVKRRLEWLRTQVAPTVRWLCEEGHREEVLDVLNLEPPA